MSYTVAVCDDDARTREHISSLVQRWSCERKNDVRVSTYDNAEAFLFSESAIKSDILLLDIEMGAINGVELAHRVRTFNKNMQIVFITGYSDYIAEGYDVAALHYLMKPVNVDKLFSVLDRAVELIHKNERVLTIETAGETARIPVYQIHFIDVQKNYATVHAAQDYTIKRTLNELEGELDERFFRVGRSAIVNLACISRVTKTDIHLTTGETIPLPRGAYDAVNRAIIGMK